ncbi:CPBP family intramembrane glutamic endopeptidase [Desulfatitalea alkaliphila]|uniref:CPBP family intramembrane metalloprotease n=1 Tax=Desulfatitalea alkaliphila TaxID=2929485 RepID=A0AA41R4P2_9BACT|nr:CPBP family intramembrane glutamic endopeptidase [Desulfatitalea alkaliphila]MCJ8502299.1 CPBP family intramembrane metalloprotease [Desulfatitalea alkaliphila]
MAPKPFSIRPLTLAATAAWVVGLELLAAWWLQRVGGSPLPVMALVRLVQILGMIWWVVRLEGSLGPIGWAPGQWGSGLRTGALWSLALGLAALAGLLLLHWGGQNPLAMIRHPVPAGTWERPLFFLVGGFIVPLAEEVFFRGIFYTFLRRWGVVVALVVSTAVFVLLHAVHGIPYTQIAGGVVFALTYERYRNLMVPITIHAAGNLTIFTLSLLFR